MTRIVAVESVSLDGVMQAPGRVDEDTRGGFEQGGWASPYHDEVSARVAGEGMARDGGLLFGRFTYELFYESWAGRDDNPFSAVLDARQKYVVSNSLGEPLPWQNSTLLTGVPVEAVVEVKASAPEEELVLMGSGVLLRSLLRAGLLDALQLSIHPLVLGAGTRLFGQETPHAQFKLDDSIPTTTGVVIANYDLAGQ